MKNSKAYLVVALLLLLLSVSATVGVCYLYKWTYNWDVRISKIEEIAQRKASMQTDSLIKTLEIRDIKESLYISQLDYLSDWLIAFVTLLFGISIVSQLFLFEARIKRVSDQYEEQKTDSTKHIEEVEKRFKKAEATTLRTLRRLLYFQCQYCSAQEKYRFALQKASEIITVTKEASKLDQDIEDLKYTTLNALLLCYYYISVMYTKMVSDEGHLDFHFFFHSSESKNYIKYFNDLEIEDEQQSKDEIVKILEKLESGRKKAIEISTKNSGATEKDPFSDLA